MSNYDDPGANLHNLKRKRARERDNVTRFTTAINGFTEDTSLNDYKHYRVRLEDTLKQMTKLDDAIHDLLSDEEYDSDIINCEEYIDKAKRAILKATRGTENKFFSSTAQPDVNGRIHKLKATNLCFLCFNSDPFSWSSSSRTST
jgi:hypothetical protein